MGHADIERENSHRRHNDYTVRTRSETTIANHCALEIFAYFMDTMATKIKEVGGRTEQRRLIARHMDPGTNDSGRTNTVLESISHECVATGLAHDLAEAYTVIVPAFAKRGLLPKSLSGNKNFRQHVKDDSARSSKK